MHNTFSSSFDDFWSLATPARHEYWRAQGFPILESAYIACVEVEARQSTCKECTIDEALSCEVSVLQTAADELELRLHRNGYIEVWPVKVYRT